MRTVTYLVLAAAASTAGCEKTPDPEYRLTAAQLSWQPYQVGQMLRFGTGNSAAVRSYTISSINDRLETHNPGGGINLFPVRLYKLQEIDVEVVRTDSVSAYGATPHLQLGAASELTETSAYVNWGYSFGHELPLDALLGNQPLPDTTATLLPQVQLGARAYQRVLRLSGYGGVGGPHLVRRAFYAERIGLVGFVEGRTLWYRLP